MIININIHEDYKKIKKQQKTTNFQNFDAFESSRLDNSVQATSQQKYQFYAVDFQN